MILGIKILRFTSSLYAGKRTVKSPEIFKFSGLCTKKGYSGKCNCRFMARALTGDICKAIRTARSCRWCSVRVLKLLSNGGAGGNRTPVHQPLSARDTTIPTSTLRSVTGGSATRALGAQVASRLSELSLVFPNVSVLSRCHSPLLLPGCGELAPCDLAAHGCSPTA